MYNSSEPNSKVFNIQERTFNFGVSIINLIQHLPRNTAGFAVSSQIVRSGTSIGANVEESQNASTRKDFIHSMTISLKEARETEYWLRIIKETHLIEDQKLIILLKEINELIRILTVIIKNTKINGNISVQSKNSIE